MLLHNTPVAPGAPFQLPLLTQMFEWRQATPSLPPSFRLPKTQDARTPEAAGSQLKPAPRHRITLFFILFANKIKGACCPSRFTIHPALALATRCSRSTAPNAVTDPKVRKAAGNAVNTTGVQGTKDPRRTNARSRRIAMEASPNSNAAAACVYTIRP